MDAEETPILERVISTDTKETLQIKEKRMEMELAKLEARLKETKDRDTRLERYLYDDSKKALEFQYQIKERTYKFTLDLRNNYPFFPPQVRFDVPADATSPCEFQSASLDEILGEQWSPCLHLWSIAERCGDYLSVCLVDISEAKNDSSSVQRLFYLAKSFNRPKLTLALIILVSIILRLGVAMVGMRNSEDYEAHRYWMVKTITTPPINWYNGSKYQCNPPLYAYFHYAMGTTLQYFGATIQSEDDSMLLKASMRLIILAFDLLIQISGVSFFVRRFYRNLESSHNSTFLFFALNTPCILLTDYGLLNYCAVSLGLCLWSVVLIASKYYTGAAMLFCLAVNFDQRILLYALPFFLFVVARIFIDSKELYKSFFSRQTDPRLAAKVFQYLYWLLKVGCIVIIAAGINIVLWTPFIFSDFPVLSVVFSKILSISEETTREVKPNLWHFIGIAASLNLSGETIARASTILILLSSLPSIVTIVKRSNLKCFLIALFNVSMAFFLFSPNTHEKDILLPLMPFTMMFYNYIHIFTTTTLLALFSNYFRFATNNLTIVYFFMLVACSLAGYGYEHGYSQNFNNSLNLGLERSWVSSRISCVKRNQRSVQIIMLAVLLGFHLLEWISSHYGELAGVCMRVNAVVSFLGFFAIWLYSHMLMYGNAMSSEDKDTNLLYTLKKMSKAKKICR
eukprot:TRINITY_DN132_c0_g5_i1.p1 TRINITY_DN132_c0_g5~~TRINITY_DN132_c0_g5_i1.p1  ORF type:complete len:683 (-),score=94.26 TRINITY_DN132_c0_g5_i1:44-2092(-)